jgi:hypothetical protein
VAVVTVSALLAVEEERDGLVDAASSGRFGLCADDAVDVVSLHAVRETIEERST